MFTSGVVESQKEEVELHDLDPAILSSILKYMYTGEITVNAASVESLFAAASMFEMLPVCELCSSYMKLELHLTNCIGIFRFANLHNYVELQVESRKFIAEHFGSLLSSPELMELSFEEISQIISDDDLNISQEEPVFELVKSWVEYDLENRRRFLKKLAKLVRFTFIDLDYLSEKVASLELVDEDMSTKMQVMMAKTYKLTHTDILSVDAIDFDFNLTPRFGMFNLGVLIFSGGGESSDMPSFGCYDPVSKKNYFAIKGHANFDFKNRLDYHRLVVTGSNDIYLVGGVLYDEYHYNQAPALSQLKYFDIKEGIWEEKQAMNFRRCAHAAVGTEDTLFVLGGKSAFPDKDGVPLDSVECYDTEIDRWNVKSHMPAKLYHHDAVLVNENIYVIGGINETNEVQDHFLCYSIELDQWSTLETPMHHARAEFGATLNNNEIFVIGGTDGNMNLTSVEIYNFDRKKWRFGPDFYEDRKSQKAFSFNNSVYIMGGLRMVLSRSGRPPREAESKDLWKLDLLGEAWIKEAKFVQYANIHGVGQAVINKKLIKESDFVSSAGMQLKMEWRSSPTPEPAEVLPVEIALQHN